jgi:hypothetical protein
VYSPCQTERMENRCGVLDHVGFRPLGLPR